jgi:hypothetical protein
VEQQQQQQQQQHLFIEVEFEGIDESISSNILLAAFLDQIN